MPNPRLLLLAGLAFILACPRASGAADKPNILWISAEDIGPDLGSYGDPLARTPNLDALAADGLRFEHAYANFPVCAPARSTLIFGIYASTLGTEHMRSFRPVPRWFRLLPQYLRQAGYYCSNNHKTDYNFRGNWGAAWNASGPDAHWRNRPPGRPFFSVFNIETTHEARLKPAHVDEDVAAGIVPAEPRVAPEQVVLPPYYPDVKALRTDRARLYDLIDAMDAEVGTLLGQLETDGLADDTIVLFFSDHGGSLPRSKRFVYDTGTRVPLILRIPERFADLAPEGRTGVSERLVSFVDFAPTMLRVAGMLRPPQMQGRAFLGEPVDAPRATVLLGRGRMDERGDLVRAVTDGNWRYVRNFQPQRPEGRYLQFPFEMQRGWKAWRRACEDDRCDPQQQAFWLPRPAEMLFHTAVDPWEVDDLAADPEQQGRAYSMRQALIRRLIETRDTGFIPESMLDTLSRPRTPYDYAQGPDYPIARIVGTAFAATDPRRSSGKSLLPLLDDPHPVIRYWALMGLVLDPDFAATAPAALLRIGADDAFPANRAAAAAALAGIGEEAPARSILLELLRHDHDMAVLDAMNRIEDLDGVDAVPIDEIDRIISARKTHPWSARLADHWHAQRGWRRWWPW